jgi:hypothetical protein
MQDLGVGGTGVVRVRDECVKLVCKHGDVFDGAVAALAADRVELGLHYLRGDQRAE